MTPAASMAQGLRGQPPEAMFAKLVAQGADRVPLPGGGRTIERWRVLAAVAAEDLALAKLFEGHTDALAILAELGASAAAPEGSTWGVWAAEDPRERLVAEPGPGGSVRLAGVKRWCSGAAAVSDALVTAWPRGADAPLLVHVRLGERGIERSTAAWQAVGMARSASADLQFDGVPAQPIGAPGAYLSRPGFWHGGAGLAACWFGAASALADALRRSARPAAADAPLEPRAAFRHAALGAVDVLASQAAALLREAAAWIDAHPHADASGWAWRTRGAADACARAVLDQVARDLGPAPFCRDAQLARLAADLPIFIRQCHAERDHAALGAWLAARPGAAPPWAL